MTIDDKKLIAEIEDLKINGDKIYAEQSAKREALLNDPANAKMLKKIQLGLQIAKTVYDARISAKLTQQQLAEKLHTQQSYIAEVERGRRNLTIGTLDRYVEACGRHIELRLI